MLQLNRDEEGNVDRLNTFAIVICAITLSIVCAAATYCVLCFVPRTKHVPFGLEFWMAWGWLTGLYLSFAALVLRPIAKRLFAARTLQYCDIVHGLQLPIVVGGVATFIVGRVLGYW